MSRPALVAVLLATGVACASPRPTELVNVTFAPSVETDHYATWDFDLAACRDTGDPRVDDAFVRAHLLAAIRDELEARGYARKPGEPVDFRVSYELWIDEGGPDAVEERGRGRILVRDVATGRFVWRGERKARIVRPTSTEERVERIRLFARELLQYTRKLEDPARRGS